MWQFKTYCLNFESPAFSGYETGKYSADGPQNYLAYVDINVVTSALSARLREAVHRGYCE